MIFNAYNQYIEFEYLGRIEKIEIVNAPPVIYRFLGEEYAHELISKGKIQIKHHGYYREIECGNRNDKLDGISRVTLTNGHNNTHTIVSMDAYILCFSSNPYKFLANKFAVKGKRSVCIKISKPNEFIYELDKLVRNYLKDTNIEVNASVSDQVAYYDPSALKQEHNAVTQLPVVMRKPVGNDDDPYFYAEESEYRVVWDLATRNAKREPFFIESGSLVDYVEIMPENELIELEQWQEISFRSLI